MTKKAPFGLTAKTVGDHRRTQPKFCRSTKR